MTTLVSGARQLLTLRGDSGPRRGAALRELGIVPNGAVLIKDGVIVEAGPARRIEKLPGEARRAREIDAAGRVVMPGFVDSHTHLVFGRPRLVDYEMRLAGASYAEIAAAGGGILSSVEAVRGMPAAQLEAQARASLDAMARHGTTTLEAKSGYALDEAGELKTLRLLAKLGGDPLDIVPTYLGAHIPPPEYRGRPTLISTGWLPRCCRRSAAASWRASWTSIAMRAHSRWINRGAIWSARRLGFGLKIHAEQFARTGAARLAVELEAASADHLEQAGEEDIRALAQSNTIATLLPGSVFHLGSAHLRAGARPDRSRSRGGAGHRFQSRHQSHLQHADGAFAGLHRDAHVAGGSDRRRHHQRRARARVRGSHRLAGAGQTGRPADPRRPRLPRTTLLLRREQRVHETTIKTPSCPKQL
jgi:imidazolonepropionase